MTIGQTNQKRKKLGSFSRLFVFWLFVSVLPQFLRLTREDSQGTILKAASVGIIVLWTVIDLLKQNSFALKREDALGFLALLWIILLSNFFINRNMTMDAYISIACTLLYYYIFMCQYVHEGISRAELSRIASCVELLVLYTCIMNYVIYGDEIISLLSTFDADAYNISSVFFNRTNYASFLLVGTIFIVLKLREKNTRKFPHIILLVLAIANMLLTLARTSIFAMLAFFIVLFFLYGHKGIAHKTVSFIIAAGIIITVLYATGAYEFVGRMIIRPQAGLTYRDSIWRRIIGDIENASFAQYWFGFGVSYGREAHNTLMGTMTKMGLLGSILYLTVYYRSIRSIRTILKNNREEGVIFISIFVAFIATSFTEEFTPFMSTSMSVIWTFTAILLPKYYANGMRSTKSNV